MSHYFIDDPKLIADERRFAHYLSSTRLDFVSDAGLFSHGHVDGATDLLLRMMIADEHFLPIAGEHGKFLDLGCGWGAVGVAAVKLFPALRVTFADVNPKALHFAAKNAKANNISGKFILSDAFENLSDMFDIIVLNPPIHAGKDICCTMLTGSAKHLTPGGALYVVMHKKHGALSMIEKLTALFDVKILCRKKGVLVFRCMHKL